MNGYVVTLCHQLGHVLQKGMCSMHALRCRHLYDLKSQQLQAGLLNSTGIVAYFEALQQSALLE